MWKVRADDRQATLYRIGMGCKKLEVAVSFSLAHISEHENLQSPRVIDGR